MKKDVRLYSVDDLKKSYKNFQRKIEFQRKIKIVKEFVIANKEYLIVLVPVVVKIGGALIKGVNRKIDLKKQQDLRDLYCYDRSLGHYWALKRNLSNKEWVEVDNRKRNGETLADIFRSMNVLK